MPRRSIPGFPVPRSVFDAEGRTERWSLGLEDELGIDKASVWPTVAAMIDAARGEIPRGQFLVQCTTRFLAARDVLDGRYAITRESVSAPGVAVHAHVRGAEADAPRFRGAAPVVGAPLTNARTVTVSDAAMREVANAPRRVPR